MSPSGEQGGASPHHRGLWGRGVGRAALQTSAAVTSLPDYYCCKYWPVGTAMARRLWSGVAMAWSRGCSAQASAGQWGAWGRFWLGY